MSTLKTVGYEAVLLSDKNVISILIFICSVKYGSPLICMTILNLPLLNPEWKSRMVLLIRLHACNINLPYDEFYLKMFKSEIDTVGTFICVKSK